VSPHVCDDGARFPGQGRLLLPIISDGTVLSERERDGPSDGFFVVGVYTSVVGLHCVSDASKIKTHRSAHLPARSTDSSSLFCRKTDAVNNATGRSKQLLMATPDRCTFTAIAVLYTEICDYQVAYTVLQYVWLGNLLEERRPRDPRGRGYI